MGQDICSQVNICNNPLETIEVEPVGFDKTNQNSKQENLESSSLQFNEKTQPSPPNNQGEQSQKALKDDIDVLSQIAKKLGSFEVPKQIVLSIDQNWIDHPLFKEGEGFKNYYRQIVGRHDRSYSVFQRNGQENAKIQILYQQHIPFTGVFFLKIYLLEYQPQKGFNFAIGIVDYLQATNKKHSKDSGFEQSFVLKMISYPQINSQQNGAKIKKTLNLTVELLIDRVENKIILRLPESFRSTYGEKIKIYGDQNEELSLNEGQRELSLKIKQCLLVSEVSLSPYIQTQNTGLVLAWDKYSIKSTNCKLSTIIEEGSSIISTI